MEFEKSISVSNGLISKAVRGGKSIGSDKLEKIFSAYPDLSPVWLFTGMGTMLLTEEERPLSRTAEECKECEKLKKEISMLEQLLESKNETIRAYQSATEKEPSKGRNSA